MDPIEDHSSHAEPREWAGDVEGDILKLEDLNTLEGPQKQRANSSDGGFGDDDDFEGPSSVEAEANSSEGGFDIDLAEIPDTTYPLNQRRSPTDGDGQADEDPESNLGRLFDLLDPSNTQGCPNNPDLEENIKSETAIAGVCGFANFANTCYMNSGLQCLLATPTVVKFFTECYSIGTVSKCTNATSPKQENDFGLTDHFGPLLQTVWAGEYRQIKPLEFKENLAEAYPQFRGTQQHDCQEFLALLLDTLHEELRAANNEKVNNQSECGTSMELHTPHSTEKSAPLSIGWLSRHSSFDNGSSEAKKVITTDSIPDEIESRGSPAGSPKSFDSHSSIEDKVTLAIRHCPIPKEVKTGKFADEDDLDEESMDSLAGVCGPSIVQPTSNLIAPDNLKRANVVRFLDEGTKSSVNNISSGLGKSQNSCKSNAALTLSDYMKESKTLNVNVLAEDDEEMNNGISFDSDKFARHEKIRLREAIDNLNTVDPSEGKATANKQTKRLKTINVPVPADTNGDICSSCACSSSDDGSHPCSADSSCDFNGIKRIRLDSSDKEKNVQFERERLQQQQGGACGPGSSPTSGSSLDPARLKEAIEADRFWEKYLASNDTVVARTFQGQFKNTVVCTVCGYVSVSFEPFMYLPVPLPNAHILQLDVVYVSCQPFQPPLSILVNMSPADTAATLKEKVISLLNLSIPTSNLSVAEVIDNHVARVVEDWTSLRHLKEDRKIYVLEVIGKKCEGEDQPNICDNEETPASASSESNNQENGGPVVQSCSIDTGGFPGVSPEVVITCAEKPVAESIAPYPACVICMDDFPPEEMRQHNACDCVMCSPCLDRTIEHHQGSTVDFDETASMSFADGQIKCPGCRQDADPSTEFVTLDLVGKSKPRLRTFILPVVSRLDNADDNFKNKHQIITFGHPTLVQVSNCVTGSSLFKLLSPVNPLLGSLFEFVLVNPSGRTCSRCLFGANCSGCIRIDPSDDTEDVLLQPSDTIAFSFTGNFVSQNDLDRVSQTSQHASMNQTRLKDKLDLQDCLSAFSEREFLDESNPWYCAVCRKHQCASKTLSIWRFPDFLIIYLKRFVYVNNSTGSLKLDKSVSFKVNNLDLTPFLSGPLQADSRPVFNLYGCVCHFGSVGGGHYTAYSRHLGSGEWNYFDDGSISENEIPGESPGDYSSAYILFYQREGSRCENEFQSITRQCRAFALESNGHHSQENGQMGPKTSPTESTEGSEPMILQTCDRSNQLEEDDEDMRPDLSQIIRSLDTPPPS